MNNRIVKSTLAAAIASGMLLGCSTSKPESEHSSFSNNTYQCDVQTHQAANDLRIYQIMTESFIDGDPTIGHGTGYGTSHHNGDIQGIIDSLDYIQSLGVNAIWLTPIFDSIPVKGQDHWVDRLDATGYFASNYFAIDPRFGTLEKAKELVQMAHEKGLYVFFDGVFGHHKGNVAPSPSGLLPVGENNPVSYPESLAFYQEVATYWIKELKIDGWRLDQAYQVPTDAWVELRKSVDQTSKSVTYTNHEGKTVNPLGYMVAEIWNNESYISETGYGDAGSPALCSAFDFPVRYRIVETFAVNENGIGSKGGQWLDQGMDLHSVYPDHAKPNLMLGNHDLVRFGDLLQRGGIAEPQSDEYWQRHKAALSFQAAYSGPITLYYGDEIGDQTDNFAAKRNQETCAIAGYCDDHVARTSAKVEGVSASLNTQQKDLKRYVTALMALRSEHSALSQGKRTNVLATSSVYVDHKQAKNDAVLYMVSTQDNAQAIELTGSEIGSKGTLVDLMSGERFELNNGFYQIPLHGFQARFLEILSPSELKVEPVLAQSALAGEGFMAQCDNPTLEGGPMDDSLYVVGDFLDSGWQHKTSRQFEYKGNNTYQVVVDEKAGGFRTQFASKSWSPQFTADGLELSLGKEAGLKKGGYGKDTAVVFPEVGRYVWSLSFTDSGEPLQMMVSKCL